MPAAVWEAVDEADVVLRAVYWADPGAAGPGCRSRAPFLVAWWEGSMTVTSCVPRLPERADANLGGLRFTVTHEAGVLGRRVTNGWPGSTRTPMCWSSGTATSRGTRRPPTVYGCSIRAHRPTGGASRYCTYMTASVDRGELIDVTLHRV